MALSSWPFGSGTSHGKPHFGHLTRNPALPGSPLMTTWQWGQLETHGCQTRRAGVSADRRCLAFQEKVARLERLFFRGSMRNRNLQPLTAAVADRATAGLVLGSLQARSTVQALESNHEWAPVMVRKQVRPLFQCDPWIRL